MYNDTICAISTAMGMGAIGIVRISGDEAQNIIKNIFVGKDEKPVATFENRKLTYGYILDEDGKKIDEVLVAVMKGPHTYTCEDVVEINCHGGMISLKRIMMAITSQGARIAEAGEFTKRAFLNGRLDLVQAESVMDLVSAKTAKGFDVAMQQLEGHVSKSIKDIREKIISLMAEIEVCIDYPEEDIEEITYKGISDQLKEHQEILQKIIEDSDKGKLIREGIKTVIVGRPNVGKSSLLNALLKESRAIVTDIPGTTRDVIEEIFVIEGMPIKIVDTAGIRQTDDLVEKIGVDKSKAMFNEADLTLVVLNGAEPLMDEDRDILEKISPEKTIVLINKMDLPMALNIEEVRKYMSNEDHILKSSALKSQGIDQLEKLIVKIVQGDHFDFENTDLLTNSRHITAVKLAQRSLKDALKLTLEGMPYDFIEVDIKEAIDELGKVTGESVEGDLLNNIFSNFCLGK